MDIWVGKALGAALGFMAGGPLGGLLGAILGHKIDKRMQHLPKTGRRPNLRNPSHTQTIFYTSTFSIMGCLCKADGRISEKEIATAMAIMDRMELSVVQKKSAKRLFNRGKEDGFPLDQVLMQLRKVLKNRRPLAHMFLEVQLTVAFSDGSIQPEERELLSRVCRALSISRFEYQYILAAVEGQWHKTHRPRQARPRSAKPQLSAYSVLGIPASSSNAEIKKAYRRLLSQNHPDKLVSKGLPEEMIKLATQKTHEIRQAYEQICEARGI